MSRHVAGFAVVAMCACASSAGSPSPDVSTVPVTDRITTSTGGAITIGGTATAVGIPGEVAAAPDAVFQALSAVYADLAIPATEVTPKDRAIGNLSFKARRRIGGVPMQRYFDCGGSGGQPNAETFNLVITINSYVTAGRDGGSVVTTRIQAVGSDPAHGDSNQLRCTSEGELELRIAQMSRERLGVKK
jgi:hypothetical protein